MPQAYSPKKKLYKDPSWEHSAERLRILLILRWLLFAAITVFSILRLFNLDADFPLGITSSGVLYTDEGWYSNAAVRHIVSGDWYLTGDFNPAINMPVGQLLHRGVFALAGLSIRSARITTTVAFLLLTLLTALLVRKHFGDFSGLLTALLLATNYIAFAHSRLAVMECPATVFVVASLLVAVSLQTKKNIIPLLLSSLLLALGILTKTTSVFALPLLAYLAWRRGTTLRHRLLLLLVVAVMLFLVAGGYFIFVKAKFPEDYSLFTRINVTGRIYGNISDILHVFWKRAFLLNILGRVFLGLSALSTITALLVCPRFRSDPLVHIFIGWIVIYWGILSTSSYIVPRYYVPLIVPFAGLCAAAVSEISSRLSKPQWYIVPVVLVLAVVLQQGGKIANYMRNPEFSFVEMAHDVASVIQRREQDLSRVVLLGNMSDSIALEIGTRSVNASLGTRDLAWKLANYHPRYFVSPADLEIISVLKRYCKVTLLGSWDVYRNYYQGQKVRLFQLDYKDEVLIGPTEPGFRSEILRDCIFAHYPLSFLCMFNLNEIL